MFILYSSFVLIGLLAGILGGIVGIGGGIVLVPALVLFWGFKQQMAQGTTLAALIPPVGFFAAYVYYKNGNVNVTAALLIGIGFLLGGFFGATFAQHLDQIFLKKLFAVLMIGIGIKMFL